MNWYSGTIAEAVQLAKSRNAVFVVFVEGPNENSKAMAALVDAEAIRTELESPDYVAIRVQTETEAYNQFCQIYKLVPCPSIFFLGENGAPITIVTELTKTVDELHAKIQSLSTNASASSVAAPAPNAASTSSTAAAATASSEAASATADAASAAERLERAKQLLEKKRKEHEAEQRRLERERELQRRREGQDLRSFKERQTELDLKQMKEERQRDKLAEQAIRKRILDQIAQDRATNAARFANSTADAAAAKPTEAAAAPAPPRVYNGTEARIQFRKPDGTLAAHDFLAADHFQTVRDYVCSELLGGNGNFTLASSFPRRQFGVEDANTTLAQLELVPTAVILVHSTDKSLQARSTNAASNTEAAASTVRGAAAAVSRVNVFALAQTAFWTLMVPVLAIVGYLRNLVGRGAANGGAARDATGAQKRESEEILSDNDAAKRRNLRIFQQEAQASASAAAAVAAATTTASQESAPTKPYKRVAAGGSSNIHRLHETQDSDDDTNTWNGNSTQQQ